MTKTITASLLGSAFLTASMPALADASSRWEGFFGGIWGAEVSSNTSWSGSGIHDADGIGINGTDLDGFTASSESRTGTGGLTLGYNRKYGDFLYGAELDYGRLNYGKSLQVDGSEGEIQLRSKVKGVSSLRMRAGIVHEKILIYSTAGLAWINTDDSFIDLSNAGDAPGTPQQFKLYKQLGWAAGLGLEYALSDSLSFRLEYLRYEFGHNSKSYSNTFGGEPAPSVSLAKAMDMGRIGLLYSFK